MKKYKNLSGKDIGFIIHGKTFDFENGEVCSVPDNFKEEITKAISKLEDVTPKVKIVGPIPIPIKKIKVIPKGYKECLNCKKIFKPKRKTQKYCSRKCYNEWRRKT